MTAPFVCEYAPIRLRHLPPLRRGRNSRRDLVDTRETVRTEGNRPQDGVVDVPTGIIQAS
jgi:hypothetical protein